MNNEGNNNNGYMSVWLLFALLGGFLWLLLIVLKVTGVVSLHWILVLTGGFWIPFLLLTIATALAAVLIVAAKAKRWHRRRKVDRRIIRQAKAAGIWTPEAAGGRALELLAKEYGLHREPGETDKDLRIRIKKEKEARKV